MGRIKWGAGLETEETKEKPKQSGGRIKWGSGLDGQGVDYKTSPTPSGRIKWGAGLNDSSESSYDKIMQGDFELPKQTATSLPDQNIVTSVLSAPATESVDTKIDVKPIAPLIAPGKSKKELASLELNKPKKGIVESVVDWGKGRVEDVKTAYEEGKEEDFLSGRKGSVGSGVAKAYLESTFGAAKDVLGGAGNFVKERYAENIAPMYNVLNDEITGGLGRGDRVSPILMEQFKKDPSKIFNKDYFKELPAYNALWWAGHALPEMVKGKNPGEVLAEKQKMDEEYKKGLRDTWGEVSEDSQLKFKQVYELMDENGNISVDDLDTIDLPKFLKAQLLIDSKSAQLGIPKRVLEDHYGLAGFSDNAIVQDFGKLVSVNQKIIKDKFDVDLEPNDVFTIMRDPDLRKIYELPNQEFEGGSAGILRYVAAVADQALMNIPTKPARMISANKIKEKYASLDSPEINKAWSANEDMIELYLEKAKKSGKSQTIKVNSSGNMGFFTGKMVIDPNSNIADVKASFNEAYLTSVLGNLENLGKRSDTQVAGMAVSMIPGATTTAAKGITAGMARAGMNVDALSKVNLFGKISSKYPFMANVLKPTYGATKTNTQMALQVGSNVGKTAVKNVGNLAGNAVKLGAQVAAGSESGFEDQAFIYSVMFGGALGALGATGGVLSEGVRSVQQSKVGNTLAQQGVAFRVAKLSDSEVSTVFSRIGNDVATDYKGLEKIISFGDFKAIHAGTRSQISAEANLIKMFGEEALADPNLSKEQGVGIQHVMDVLAGRVGEDNQVALKNILSTHFSSVNGMDPIQYRNMYVFMESAKEVFDSHVVMNIMNKVDPQVFKNTDEFMGLLKANKIGEGMNTGDLLSIPITNRIGTELTDEEIFKQIFIDVARTPTTRFAEGITGKTATLYSDTKTAEYLENLNRKRNVLDTSPNIASRAAEEFEESLLGLENHWKSRGKSLSDTMDDSWKEIGTELTRLRTDMLANPKNYVPKEPLTSLDDVVENIAYTIRILDLDDVNKFKATLKENPHLVYKVTSDLLSTSQEFIGKNKKVREAFESINLASKEIDTLRDIERMKIVDGVQTYYNNKMVTPIANTLTDDLVDPNIVSRNTMEDPKSAINRATGADPTITRSGELLRDAHKIPDVAKRAEYIANNLTANKTSIEMDEVVAQSLGKRMANLEEVDFAALKKDAIAGTVKVKNIGIFDALETSYGRPLRAAKEIENIITANPNNYTAVEKLQQVDLLIGKVTEDAMVRKFITDNDRFTNLVTQASTELANLPIGNKELHELTLSLVNNPKYGEIHMFGSGFSEKNLQNILDSGRQITKESVDIIAKSYKEVTGENLKVLPFLATFINKSTHNLDTLSLYGMTMEKLSKQANIKDKITGGYVRWMGSGDMISKIVGRESGVSIFNAIVARYNGNIQGYNASIAFTKNLHNTFQEIPLVKKYLSSRQMGDVWSRLSGSKGILDSTEGVQMVMKLNSNSTSQEHMLIQNTKNVVGDFVATFAEDGSMALTSVGRIFKDVFIDNVNIGNVLKYSDTNNAKLTETIKAAFLREVKNQHGVVTTRMKELVADPTIPDALKGLTHKQKVEYSLLTKQKALLEVNHLPFVDKATNTIRGALPENHAGNYFSNYFRVRDANPEHYKSAFMAFETAGKMQSQVWRESSDIILENNKLFKDVLGVEIQPFKHREDYYIGSVRNKTSGVLDQRDGLMNANSMNAVKTESVSGRWKSSKSASAMSQIEKANSIDPNNSLHPLQALQRYAYQRFTDASTIHSTSALNNQARTLTEMGFNNIGNVVKEWAATAGAPPALLSTAKVAIKDYLYRTSWGRTLILATTPVGAIAAPAAKLTTGPARMIKNNLQGHTMLLSRTGSAQTLYNLPNMLKNGLFDTFITQPFDPKLQEKVFRYNANTYTINGDLKGLAEKAAKGVQQEFALARNQSITYMAGTAGNQGRGSLESMALGAEGVADFLKTQVAMRMKEQVEFSVSRSATNAGLKSFERVATLLEEGDVIAARKIIQTTFRGYTQTDVNSIVGMIRKGIEKGDVNEVAFQYFKNYHSLAVGQFGGQSASLQAKNLASMIPGMSTFYSSAMMAPAMVIDALAMTGGKVLNAKGVPYDLKQVHGALSIIGAMVGFGVAEHVYNYGTEDMPLIGDVVKFKGMVAANPALALLDGSTAGTQTAMDFGLLARRNEMNKNISSSRLARRTAEQAAAIIFTGTTQPDSVTRAVTPFGLADEVGVYDKFTGLLSAGAAQAIAGATGGEAINYDVWNFWLKISKGDEWSKLTQLPPEHEDRIKGTQKMAEEYRARYGTGFADALAKGTISMLADHSIGNIFRETFKDPVYTYHMITHFNSEEVKSRMWSDPKYKDLKGAIMKTGSFPMGTLLGATGLDSLFNVDYNTMEGTEAYKYQVASFMEMLAAYGVAYSEQDMTFIMQRAEETYKQFNGPFKPMNIENWRTPTNDTKWNAAVGFRK